MAYGLTITTKGDNYLAKLIAGDTLNITKVVVGSGKLALDQNPALLEDLIAPFALATATKPVTVNSVVHFAIEYRSDMNGGLGETKWINEYGVFVEDPQQGEILLYYGTLGDCPEPVYRYVEGYITIRRYPVAIVLSKDLHVTVNFHTAALVTSEEMERHKEDQKAHGILTPTHPLTTIRHDRGAYPVCQLTRAEHTAGVTPAGEGPAGGTPPVTIRFQAEYPSRNEIRLLVTEDLAGEVTVNQLDHYRYALLYPEGAASLMLILAGQ